MYDTTSPFAVFHFQYFCVIGCQLHCCQPQHQVLQLLPSCSIHPNILVGYRVCLPLASNHLSQPSLLCFVRYVCPVGSSSPHFPSNACPPGTVGNDFNLFDKSQCETCPAGFVCVRGRWLYDKVNCVLWYPVSQSPPVCTRAGHHCVRYHNDGKWEKVAV